MSHGCIEQETLLDLHGKIPERMKETPAIGWVASTLHPGGADVRCAVIAGISLRYQIPHFDCQQ
jgi:hypothetical protein